MARHRRTKPGCCCCCNRPLRDPASVARGVGPECLTNPDCRCVRKAAERLARPALGYRFVRIEGDRALHEVYRERDGLVVAEVFSERAARNVVLDGVAGVSA